MLAGLMLAAFAAVSAAAADGRASLQNAWGLMYGCEFQSAERAFLQWRLDNPRSPLGPVSLAANTLFSELDRLGVLQAQFFVDDSAFTSNGGRLAPNAGLRVRFDAAVRETEQMARDALGHDKSDPEALLALALASGLRADYAALIEGRNLAGLAYTRESAQYARRLLAAAPDQADAYLATGMSDYIVGSLSAPLRFFLRFAGYSGHKSNGIEQLQRTAERGQLLAPLARILLAIAHLRDGDKARARSILVGLNRDFPANALFAREIRRIDTGAK